MSRPVKEITDEMILSQMEPGTTLTVRRMARRLSAAEERVRKKMIQMVDERKLLRERESASFNSFYQYFIDAEPMLIANGEFEVAAPLIPVDLTSHLKGYDASFTRMRDLCMSIRRAA